MRVQAGAHHEPVALVGHALGDRRVQVDLPAAVAGQQHPAEDLLQRVAEDPGDAGSVRLRGNLVGVVETWKSSNQRS